ncbi:nickel ABC transporter permease [Brevibacillus centrosporus]|uniref:Nickel import system permease protein NikB n=1 Tax=Brevibacillus centrosporus TaxID=54910 RepID=A0A1I3ZW98_9BACL|nr:nickel ABC transporter permease [Brevibacillus centrosporus]MEC2131800.1 ABC transporter permease [Brevibacillus centrosporus]MED1952999.1 ABC transporter permease [Brevibacillus centrosporus]MED4908510.1 ABC transporter permease [Brevibacillus centrosporus]RNB67440.1 ABC transporter permease [Brevibacillus centrosporus]SFK47926.1 peptide/nickel transport system permease protein [Brevibacillus centrosporus]
MLGYIAKRLLQMIPTLIGVSILCFIIIHSVPGDPANLIAGVDATAEEIQIVKERLGLDRPLYEQYGSYVMGLLQGDMGKSLRSDRPVAEELLTRFPSTIMLTMLSVVVMVLVGLFAGIMSAIRPNSMRDNATMMVSLFGISMPVFWSGIMLILVFSYYLQWLPSGGSTQLKHYILPAIALGLSSSAVLARLTRSSILEVIHQDFIRTARAKGVREKLIIYKHTLKNALIPIITIVGLEFGHLLGGAVLTETVFSMNGIGRYIIQSIQFRDYPAIQGSILFVAAIFVIVNLVVDLCYGAVDPRIRYD